MQTRLKRLQVPPLPSLADYEREEPRPTFSPRADDYHRLGNWYRKHAARQVLLTILGAALSAAGIVGGAVASSPAASILCALGAVVAWFYAAWHYLRGREFLQLAEALDRKADTEGGGQWTN